MEEKIKLRTFLVKKFIVIMVLTGVVEYFVLFFLNNLLYPILNRAFFRDIDWQIHLNIFQIIYILLIAFVYLIVQFLKSMMPEGAANAMDWILSRFDNLTVNVVPELNENQLMNHFTPEQSTILFAVSAVSIALFVGPFVVAAGFYAREITKEVEKIQKHKEALQKEYDRKRNLMLSDIAHDLRTPMTTVAGYAKALNDGMVTDEEKREEYLHSIQVKSKRMNDLINLLFEYVKLDSDGFNLTLGQTDLAEVARESAAMISSDMEDAGMDFDIDIPEERVMVKADGVQVGRVITNLLTNSIRHNEKGTCIKISLEYIDENECQIVVADTGKPIDAKVAEHLFEPFAVSDESRSTKGGSGLGLSIAKKIVEMHGWKLELSNKIPGYTKAFVITAEKE